MRAKNNHHVLFNSLTGQIKFGETFAILIIVFFAFIFGAQFYISSLESSFQESQRETQDTQALERIERVITYGPYLDSSSNSQTRVLNKLNIESFSQLDNITKNSIFGVSTITISLYNISFNDLSQDISFVPEVTKLVIHNNTANFFEDSKFQGDRILPHRGVVSVYDPQTKRVQMGVIEVISYY
ncbi:MAG: hypothetical protein ACLFPL_01715 [Candidatus Nanoarchaeia archaeon]